MRLHHFHGGLELPRHKAQATAAAIRECPLPAVLRVPLLQHAGEPASARVQVGDSVRAGQLLAQMMDGRGASVHAPADGRVIAIETAALTAPQGLSAPHVMMEVAPRQDTMRRLPTLDWQTATPASLVERVRECGIVGMGGAGFPSADKLAVDREWLIINGAECEPWIACDDRLLRERAEAVVMGARVLRRAVSAQRVVLAVESAMTQAHAACAAALERAGAGDVELVAVPTIYPEGGERQLIKVLTGCEVPRGGLPRDIGVLVHNVGTAHATWQAVAHGEPLLRRIVTVTGPGVATPGNWDVAIGTPIAHLIEQAGGYTPAAARLLVGGPLMGTALPHDEFPITKTSNCVLVLSAAQLRDPLSECHASAAATAPRCARRGCNRNCCWRRCAAGNGPARWSMASPTASSAAAAIWSAPATFHWRSTIATARPRCACASVRRSARARRANASNRAVCGSRRPHNSASNNAPDRPMRRPRQPA